MTAWVYRAPWEGPHPIADPVAGALAEHERQVRVQVAKEIRAFVAMKRRLGEMDEWTGHLIDMAALVALRPVLMLGQQEQEQEQELIAELDTDAITHGLGRGPKGAGE